MKLGQAGLFDLSDRYAALSAVREPLERFTAVVDFEVLLGRLIAMLRQSERGKGGRPPFELVTMSKILMLQALHSLSDEVPESKIEHGLSFQRFLGLNNRAPEATTTWLFRERFIKAKAMYGLFAGFDAALIDRSFPQHAPKGGELLFYLIV